MHQDERRRFELLAMPHLDAAYNLARWLTGNGADADDVVQDAYLRAFRYFHAFRGDNMRIWLLTIVRNTFLTWAKENRSAKLLFAADPAEAAGTETDMMWTSPTQDPEALLLRRIDGTTLNRLMEKLPAEYREILVLREVEDLPYRDIATIAGIPVGTVMSRLSRARAALRRLWQGAEEAHGV